MTDQPYPSTANSSSFPNAIMAPAQDALSTPIASGQGGLVLAGAPRSKAMIGIGAAIGIGSAAIVAALLFSRRKDVPTARASGTGGPGRKVAAHKLAARKGDTAQKATAKGADRARVSANEPYEVSYFARKHKISSKQARAIIAEAGPSRSAANALAKQRAGS